MIIIRWFTSNSCIVGNSIEISDIENMGFRNDKSILNKLDLFFNGQYQNEFLNTTYRGSIRSDRTKRFSSYRRRSVISSSTACQISFTQKNENSSNL